MTARRVAAVDCGTNTIRLLIADVDPDAERPVTELVREMRAVRLGEGLEQTGEFSAAALERTDRALAQYADTIAAHQVATVRMVATSASRDVTNRDALVRIARRHLAVDPEVVSGEQEASLTFDGVRAGLGISGESIIVDIGGGSTEIITGGPSGIATASSTDIGAVRLSERHLHSDPPTAQELAALADDAREELHAAIVQAGRADGRPLIGVAGTATTAAAIARDLPGYDSRLIHASVTSAPDLRRVLQWSCARDTAARAAHPAMHPGRAAVFPAGMIILDVLMTGLEASELVVSESDILDGIALSMTDRP